MGTTNLGPQIAKLTNRKTSKSQNFQITKLTNHNRKSAQWHKCTIANVEKVHNSKREQTQNCKIAKLQILNSKTNKYKIQNPKVGIPKFIIPVVRKSAKLQ